MRQSKWPISLVAVFVITGHTNDILFLDLPGSQARYCPERPLPISTWVLTTNTSPLPPQNSILIHIGVL